MGDTLYGAFATSYFDESTGDDAAHVPAIGVGVKDDLYVQSAWWARVGLNVDAVHVPTGVLRIAMDTAEGVEVEMADQRFGCLAHGVDIKRVAHLPRTFDLQGRRLWRGIGAIAITLALGVMAGVEVRGSINGLVNRDVVG